MRTKAPAAGDSTTDAGAIGLCGDLRTKKAGLAGPASRSGAKPLLQNGNVIGLRALLALYLNEGNRLAFLQRFEAGANDGPEMDEKIAAFLPLDKTITFCFIEPLDGSSLLL